MSALRRPPLNARRVDCLRQLVGACDFLGLGTGVGSDMESEALYYLRQLIAWRDAKKAEATCAS